MKNKFFMLLFGLITAFGVFSAFDKPSEDAPPPPPQVGGYAPFNYRLDTLTNAETNILEIGNRNNTIWNTVTNPAYFLSLYTYDVKMKTASLSGTLSVKIVLDGSNVTSGTATGWVGLDSLTTTSANTVQLRSTDATATRYRLRIVATGTQSTTYQIWSFWKKKN